MEGQLIAGQWVEVSMQNLSSPLRLNAFVLSLRPSDILLTFPELLAPPEGLESEASATLRYTTATGHFTAVGHILRVASGPPVTVTLKRVVPIESGPRESGNRRSLARQAINLGVTVHVMTSRVSSLQEPEGAPGQTENISSSGMLLLTSLLLAVGDMVRLVVVKDGQKEGQSVEVCGRVVRVFETDIENRGHFGVGIAFVHASEDEQKRWLEFVASLR